MPRTPPTYFPHFGPAAPRILGFSQDFPLVMQRVLRFPVFWPYCAKNTGLVQQFPHPQTNIPRVPAESVKICRYSDPKQFLSVKLLFTYSKISLQEIIYVRLFFAYSEITARNKNICM